MSQLPKNSLGSRLKFSTTSVNAAQRDYEKDSDKTFEKASNGSPLQMITLLNNAGTFTKSHDVNKIDKLVVSIHDFLRIQGPSGNDTAETYEISTLVIDCLKALHRITSTVGKLSGKRKEVFESTLPIVVRVAKIQCEQFSKKSTRGQDVAPDQPSELAGACVGLFIAHLTNIKYSPIIDDIFEVIMKMWLLGFPSAVTAIVLSGSLSYENDPEKMRGILDETSSPKHIAHLAVSRLRKQNPHRFEEIIQHVNAIRSFSDHPRIAKRMVELGVMGVLCDTLRNTITQLPRNDIATRTTLYVVNKMLPFSMHGFQEALAHDLLPSLASVYIKLKDLPTNEDRKEALFMVTEALDTKFIPMIVCRSNLVAMLAAAENLKGPLLRRGSLGDKWVFFENRLFAVAVAYRLFIFHRTKMTCKCANPECKEVLARRKSSRCAGCKEALYCSQICQKKHWGIYGHKFECHYERRCARTVGQGVRDRAFLTFLASEEIVRHRFVLRTMAKQRFPHVPLNEIGYEVNFTGKYVALDVYSIFDPSEDHNHVCAEHVQAQRRALEVDPRRSSLRVKAGQSDRFCTFYSKIVVDEIDEDPAIQVTFDQMQSARQRMQAIDSNRMTMLSVPGIVEWIMARVKNSVGLNGTWNVSTINEEISRERTAGLLAP